MNVIFIVLQYHRTLIIAVRTSERRSYDLFEPEYGMDAAGDIEDNELLTEIPKDQLPEDITQDFDFQRRELFERIQSVHVFK